MASIPIALGRLTIASLMIACSMGTADALAGQPLSVFPNRQTYYSNYKTYDAFVVSTKDSKIWLCSAVFQNGIRLG
jgi:hypothetical protein